jgi:uncharacterized membrane protein
MSMETIRLATIILIALSFAISIYAYPLLPPVLASHWDADGNVNGHMPALVGAFIMPALSIVLSLIFIAIPYLDPLRANVETFMKDYQRLIFVIILFMFAVHVQALLWNMGTRISFNLTMPVLMGGLFIYLGYFLGKAKRNWFIGIRTPWTLSSDAVWDKTHRLGGELFKAVGVVSVLSVFLPAGGFIFVIALILGASVATVAYSFIVYRDLNAQGKNRKK